ncbi:MAG: hypothetical protein ACYTF1_21125 [Planctomycetota bacterium]|jgi:hypothetical protein
MQYLENKTDCAGGVAVVELPGKTDEMEEVWMSPNHTGTNPGLSVLCAFDAYEDEGDDIDSDFFYDDDDDDVDDDLDDDFDDDDDFVDDDDDL